MEANAVQVGLLRIFERQIGIPAGRSARAIELLVDLVDALGDVLEGRHECSESVHQKTGMNQTVVVPFSSDVLEGIFGIASSNSRLLKGL